ncbi:Aminodeoxychorismate lyase [Pseudoalteromonas luteoviolacea B = ATCC 29581]|nr:Aminodeoxychorismate lyase [Pseudoalteromonas luteoviolacea B = ATCC 29581]
MRIVTQLDVNDRGLAYGDGFFTTAKVVNGRVELWPLHLKRLQHCAERLCFEKLDLETLSKHVVDEVANHPLAVLKIMITRGSGGRGYTPPKGTMPVAIVQVLPFPSQYEGIQCQGIALEDSPIHLAHQPLLAGLKTLNRLEQVLIKQALVKQNTDDVVVTDYDGNVIESSVGNIIVRSEEQWYTPDLSQCGIEGVQLQALKSRLMITTIMMKKDFLLNAQGVFITNSLIGCVPVTRYANTNWQLNTLISFLPELGWHA